MLLSSWESFLLFPVCFLFLLFVFLSWIYIVCGLSNDFYEAIEMKIWVLSYFLLIWDIMLIDLSIYLCFLRLYPRHMEVLRVGVELELQPPAYATATATQDPATSATCTTAQGNARSLTHWVKPGIQPVSSWIVVVIVSTALQQELPLIDFWILNQLAFLR